MHCIVNMALQNYNKIDDSATSITNNVRMLQLQQNSNLCSHDFLLNLRKHIFTIIIGIEF